MGRKSLRRREQVAPAPAGPSPSLSRSTGSVSSVVGLPSTIDNHTLTSYRRVILRAS
jgi:hypothetical protein